MRRSTGFIMMGIGFTLGIVLGLLIQLPVITIPVSEHEGNNQHILKDRAMLEVKRAGSLKSDLSFEDLRLESPGTARKPISLDNPLRGLRPSLHAVVYSTNNGSKSVLEEKSKPIESNIKLYQSKSNSQNDVSKHTPMSEDFVGSSGGLSSEWTTAVKNIVNGILWTPFLQSQCPNFFDNESQNQWQKKASNIRVIKMAEGCGRMQNRLLTLSDGSKACARYRLNTDQIQGEIYSFYLAKLLNLYNLPPSSLHVLNSQSDKWKTVHADMANAEWADDRIVVLTQWIENLKPAFIPGQLRNDDRHLHPSPQSIGGKNLEELCDLVQWSDLIVFDYLTANLDRVVNNMFNRQWNNQMMNSPAHNLETTSGGNLVFLDNESGLFHGYRLLDKYSSYHKSLLDSLCIFRNSTASVVERLHLSGNIGEELHAMFVQGEPAHSSYVPKMPKKNMKILQQRIGDIYEQMQKCKTKYS